MDRVDISLNDVTDVGWKVSSLGRFTEMTFYTAENELVISLNMFHEEGKGPQIWVGALHPGEIADAKSQLSLSPVPQVATTRDMIDFGRDHNSKKEEDDDLS